MDKILIITDELPPILGGAGVVAKEIYQSIESDKFKSGFIYCSQPKSVFLRKIYKFTWPLWYIKPDLLKNILSSNTIIVNDVRSAYFVSLIDFFSKSSVLDKCNYILHGTEYIVANNETFFKRLILFSFFYKRFITRCNKISAVSLFTRDEFQASFPQEVDKQDIGYHYVGLPECFFNITSFEEKNDMNTIRFLTVSRLEVRKGLIEMLEIFSRIEYGDIRIEWFIYGSGKNEIAIRNKINELGLSDRVFLKGPMPRELIFKNEHEIYQFDLFWLLPVEPEAFGLVYLEASACHIPVLGPKQWGIKEAISEDYGFFYEPSFDWDSLFGTILDKNKRKNLSSGSRSFSIRFKLSDFVNHILVK
ncbi:glycosyltransferase family 4 protein [Vibrio fluvialis]|nr:glycosyltransferase family 4 protein [Vibrio fluvialis]